MSKRLFVLVRRPPYGTLEPGEAIRHARGALVKGWHLVLAFTDESVGALRPNQSPPSGEWVSLSEAMAALLEQGGEQARVLAEEQALEARGLSGRDLIAGVQPATRDEIARALAGCNRALIF